jgi:uncharacterized protein YlzI (FlbEa/FlbD family)
MKKKFENNEHYLIKENIENIVDKIYELKEISRQTCQKL